MIKNVNKINSIIASKIIHKIFHLYLAEKFMKFAMAQNSNEQKCEGEIPHAVFSSSAIVLYLSL